MEDLKFYLLLSSYLVKVENSAAYKNLTDVKIVLCVKSSLCCLSQIDMTTGVQGEGGERRVEGEERKGEGEGRKRGGMGWGEKGEGESEEGEWRK